jgi:hypothetical protein
MSVLSRLESAQRVDVAFREVIRTEAVALMGVVTSAVTMELRRLGRAQPGLSEWAYEALAIVSEFVPVSSASLSVEVEGIPPVWMGFGALVEPAAEDAVSWMATPKQARASVARQLWVGNHKIGEAVLTSGSHAVHESILVEVLDVLEAELPAVLESERKMRASATVVIGRAASSVEYFDDVARLETLAQSLVHLPSTIGVSLMSSSVVSIEPVRIKVGSVGAPLTVVERIEVARGMLEIAAHMVESSSYVDGSSIVHADISAVEAAVRTALIEALALVAEAVRPGEERREELVAAEIGGPNQVRFVIEHALSMPRSHNSGLLVAVIELNGDDDSPRGLALREQLLTGLARTRPPACVGRIDQRAVVMCCVLDELEARVLAEDLLIVANAAVRPKGLAPRVPTTRLGFGVSPVHGEDPDTLLAHALSQLVT